MKSINRREFLKSTSGILALAGLDLVRVASVDLAARDSAHRAEPEVLAERQAVLEQPAEHKTDKRNNSSS